MPGLGFDPPRAPLREVGASWERVLGRRVNGIVVCDLEGPRGRPQLGCESRAVAEREDLGACDGYADTPPPGAEGPCRGPARTVRAAARCKHTTSVRVSAARDSRASARIEAKGSVSMGVGRRLPLEGHHKEALVGPVLWAAKTLPGE